MKNNTQQLLASLFMITLFAACSRPVAYFQKSPREHFTTASATPAPTSSLEKTDVATTPLVASAMPEASAAPVAAPATQINQALDQMDAMVRNDSKLAADKSVQKRLKRIRTLLTLSSVASNKTVSATNKTHKSTIMERYVLKQMNKKISNQLAPQHPNKTMANTGILAAGAVLVIVGLILLLAGTSTSVGVILLLAGAVVLLVGLL